jgi:hypothetical protein
MGKAFPLAWLGGRAAQAGTFRGCLGVGSPNSTDPKPLPSALLVNCPPAYLRPTYKASASFPFPGKSPVPPPSPTSGD